MRLIGGDPADLGGELGSGAFVGVDGEHPVSGREFERGVALVGEVVERPNRDQVRVALGDRLRLVAAGAVHNHDHFVRPRDRFDATR